MLGCGLLMGRQAGSSPSDGSGRPGGLMERPGDRRMPEGLCSGRSSEQGDGPSAEKLGYQAGYQGRVAERQKLNFSN